MPIENVRFQALLEQVRELHRRTDEFTRAKWRVEENVRARLSWNDPPSLPRDQRDVADEAVEALETPKLSSSQSRKLWRTYFGK